MSQIIFLAKMPEKFLVNFMLHNRKIVRRRRINSNKKRKTSGRVLLKALKTSKLCPL